MAGSGNGLDVKHWVLVCNNYTEIAQWTANSYNIYYDGNGEDSGWVSDGTATYDLNYTFATNGYKKKGYSFVGWSTDKYATTAQYSPGQTITWTDIDGMTLYAIWSKSSYEVSFDGNGASGGKKKLQILNMVRMISCRQTRLNVRVIPLWDGVKSRCSKTKIHGWTDGQHPVRCGKDL